MNIDVFTLFPEWFGWFSSQRHVRNALDLGHTLSALDLRASTPLRAGQVDDTPYGGGAGMVIRVDVVESALRERYGTDPLEPDPGRRVIALSAQGRPLDDALATELAIWASGPAALATALAELRAEGRGAQPARRRAER